jgi:SPP1 gp7 family putative phage head morphogenesis protein
MADTSKVQPFGVQFGEAIDFLKAKLPESTLHWDDLAGPVHSKVFAIAGATNIDLVNDIHTSLKNALANGTTITQFRKDFDVAVQKYGWTYNGKRGWRTSVIFNTNMRTAHMAGRWKQLQANKESRPFLQYRTAGDARVRPQHRQWNGLIFNIDNAFWQTHYPPNGWGCRCTVRAYDGQEMKDKGLTEAPPFNLKTRTVTGADGKTKDIVPVGIDPGWDHNVGQSWISPEIALGQKLAKLPKPIQGPLIVSAISAEFQKALGANFKAFRTALKAAGRASGASQVVGFIDPDILGVLGENFPDLTVQSTSIIVMDDKTRHLSGKKKEAKPEAKGKGRRAKGSPQQVWPDIWIDSLPEHLRNYRAVLWDIEANSLVVVPFESFNDTLPKIIIRLNQKNKEGVAASVVSLGSANLGTLSNAKLYKLLLGNLSKELKKPAQGGL